VILAQFETAPEGLSSTYFTPLILAGVVYAGLFVAARVLEGREDERSETAEDAGFAVMLLSGAYVAVLLVVAVLSEMDLVWDLVRILVVVIVFFAVLVLLLLLVFERAIGGITRARRRG
jgi:uncharacterized RDD family membrane protein YckC